jgi:phage-related protein
MDLFELVAKLILDTDDYEKGLDDAKDDAGKAGGGIGAALGTAGKVAGVALTTATTAVSALATQSVKLYAESEQLEGGIETLFGAGGKSIEEYAETAKATAKDIENSGIDWDKYANTAWMENGGFQGLFDEIQYNMDELGTSAQELEEYLHFEYDLDVEDAKAAIEAYQNALTDESVTAKYESLMAAQEDVMNNAAKAYQTAGMSANDYMETVIGMAGALNKATGDTEESARLADMAIVDMADNVNKMGTSMEMVQNAYTGFSRGNYTMLDNLALGFAGTKEGMEQLLAQAESISGIEYDISSYADIVNAIHVVQTDMGIAGTTTEEAMKTISGSFGMVKASWENLVAGFGKEDADIGGLVGNFVQSAEYLLDNVEPVFSRVLEGIGAFVESIAPVLAEKLPEIVNEALPIILNAGATLILKLAEGVIQSLPTLTATIMQIITGIGNTIAEALPTLIPMIAEAVVGIVEAFSDPEALSGVLQAGVAIITGLIEGILAAIPVFIEALPTIIENLMNVIKENLPIIIEALISIVVMIAQQLPVIIMSIIEMLPTIIEMVVSTLISLIPVLIDGAIQLFLGIAQAIPQAIPEIIAKIPDIIMSIITALTDMIPELIDAGVQLFVALVGNMPQIILTIVSEMPQIISAIVKGFIDSVPKIAECGVKLMEGLAKGIIQGIVAPIKAIKEAGKKVVDNAKKAFGIHSPSKVFEELGDFIDQGFALGITDNLDAVSQAMNEMRDATAAPVDDFEDFWNTSTSTIQTGATAADKGGQMVTAILEVDKVQLGKVVFELNKSEMQRMGVNLAQGGI